MPQLTVELEEEEMAQLKATARARRIDPENMTKEQLLELLSAGKKKKWRRGLSARRARMVLKVAQGAKTARKSKVLTLRMSTTHANEVVQSSSMGGNAAALPDDQQSVVAAARAKRLEALMSMQGIWKGDPDKPQDAVAYQRELRAEWR